MIIPTKASRRGFQCFFRDLIGTCGFPRLKTLNDVSDFVGIGLDDEFVIVGFFPTKIFDEAHVLVVCIRINVYQALNLQIVSKDGGFVCFGEDDANFSLFFSLMRFTIRCGNTGRLNGGSGP